MTNEFKGKDYYEQKQDWGKSPIVQGCLKYFPRAIKAVAEVSAYGFTKYKSWGGWRDVEDGYNRYTDALGRHLIDGQIEERNPNDANLLHDAQAAWNALARLELKLTEMEKRSNGSGAAYSAPIPGQLIGGAASGSAAPMPGFRDQWEERK